VRVKHGRKPLWAYLGGELAADTASPLLVWEVPYYPAYIPADRAPQDPVHPEPHTRGAPCVHASPYAPRPTTGTATPPATPPSTPSRGEACCATG
jgi:hypothetical protein